MSRYTTGLGIVDLYGRLRSDLCLLNVVKATDISAVGLAWKWNHGILDVMRSYMQQCEQQHGIGDLPMEPDVLIKRQELDLGSNPSYYCATNWK